MPVGARFIPARIGENKKMTEHKKLQPEIRFAGFTDDWEQRKLGEFVSSLRSGLSRMLDSEDIGLPVIRANNINNGYVDLENDIKYWYQIDPMGANTRNYLVAKDDILINFINSESRMGSAAIMRSIPSRDTIYTTNILRLRLTSDLDPYWFYIQTQSKLYLEYIKSISKVAVNQASFTTVEFKNFTFFCPSTKEQTQIGNFFKQLDDTIALHQRTLEKYQKLKISYLEKMFPKENELYPELRFPNFTDAWEQRKLGEVVERITRKNLNLESRLPLTISAQDGLISQTEFFDKQVASKNISGYYLIENGEFAYNKSYSNGYPWGAIKRLDKYKNGVLSTLYIVFKPIDVDSQFLVSYFDTTFWHSEIAEIAVEGARNHGLLNIPVMDFFRIKIKIPKSKEEQTQIGSFFKQLDDTIALHQREVEKYKKIKQSYLEKMFI